MQNAECKVAQLDMLMQTDHYDVIDYDVIDAEIRAMFTMSFIV